jgi:uncharacterized protein (TIGR02453 family)
MVEKATLQFLESLRKNNNREWFEANRKKYEAAKENVKAVTETLIKALGVHDEEIGELLAKDCTFRINRDVRFSKDKAPYKSNMSCIFSKGGKNSDKSGFYVHIEPGVAFVGAGYWAPEAKKLAAVRQEIDYNFDDWKKIISSKKFTTTFEGGLSQENILQRPPKGYDIENPAIEVLKLKSFIVRKKLSDAELLDKNFVKTITNIYIVVKPMLNFLDEAE